MSDNLEWNQLLSVGDKHSDPKLRFDSSHRSVFNLKIRYSLKFFLVIGYQNTVP
jgi:hypothetical protein